MVQRTILSFFGTPKAKQPNTTSTPNSRTQASITSNSTSTVKVNDSPIKKVSGRSKINKIESDEEEEIQSITNTVKVNDSPIKKVSGRSKINKIESDEEEEIQSISTQNVKYNQDISPSDPKSSSPENDRRPIPEATSSVIDIVDPADENTSSTCSTEVLTEPKVEDVPPLRKTARKQMKRKSDCMEELQKDLIKRIRSQDTEIDKENAEEDEVMEVDTIKTNNDIKSSPNTKNISNNHHDGSSKQKKVTHPSNFRNTLDRFRRSPVDVNNKDINISPDSKTTGVNSSSPQKSIIKVSPDFKTLKTPQIKLVKIPSPEIIKGSPYKGSSPEKPVSNNPLNILSDSSESLMKSSNKSPKITLISPNKSKSVSPLKSPNVNSESLVKSSCKSPKQSPISPNKSKNVSPLKSPNVDSESSEKSSCKAPKKSPTSPSTSKSTSSIKSPNDKESVTKLTNSNKNSGSPFQNKKTDTNCGMDKKVTNPFELKGQGDKEDYDPSKKLYHPIEDSSWKRNENVPFAALCRTFQLIEDTSGRLKIVEILANFFRSVIILSPEDFLFCIYLCLNSVAPAFEGIELKVGDLYLCKALAQATGRSVNSIKSDMAAKGDLGIVAELSKSNQRMMFQPARLTVKKVFDTVKEIALMSGQASQNRKIEKVKTMFVSCKGCEARYLMRCLGGKLRIGLAEQSVLQALSHACYLTPPEQDFPPKVINAGEGLSSDRLKAKIEEHSLILKTAYCECPTLDEIIPVLFKHGMENLSSHCKLQPGIPLKPMLAHPTKGVSEVLKRFENAKFTCEYKYDGERAQIHLKEDGTINIFSRNQENNTSKYPDIISRFKNSLSSNVKSCIVDSESVAYDIAEDKILPFQILSTRKRKDAEESEIKVQVCVFPFDLLFLNGKSLVKEPFEERRRLLKENFVEVDKQFLFAKSMDTNNTEDIEEFLDESIKGNCEGLMVKTLDIDATYEIAKRSRNWLKLKKDYLDGVGDTIDVVPIGGYLGKGKRTGTYGGFLLACYDPDNEEFQSLCKIGTGFSEDMLQQHTNFFKEHIMENPKSYYRFDSGLTPDHWFDAVQVWEIKCADLSISPVHKAAAGVVDPEKGISLRFPRFLRIREDKTPENATSSSQIADLYKNQDQIKNQTTDANNEEDFY